MKRKLNIKLIIILSCIGIIAITCVVLFFTTDIFRTKRSAFFRYFNATNESLEILKIDKYNNYNEKKQTMPYTRKGEITIQNSSNIANSNILDKLKLSISQKVDEKAEKMNADISVKNGNGVLETASIIQNKDMAGVYCADIATGYICIKNNGLKRIAQDSEINNVLVIPNEINNIHITKILETSKMEKNHILDCINIIRNDVPDTAFSKDGKKRVQVNDKSYNSTAYSLKLDATDNANLMVQLLEKISTDSIVMNYLASKCKLLNFDDPYTTINSLNDMMKKKIEEFKKNPQSAGELYITVYEYKQKNIRTEIKAGGYTIQIDHLKDGQNETSSIKINDNLYKIQTDGNNITFTKDDTSETGSKIKVEYRQEGTLEENNIKNIATINVVNGIKNITYYYQDNVNFTNDIGEIQNFEGKNLAVLNDYNDNEIKEFVKNIKQKINTVYINKGASIGINLDPIF